MTILFNRATLLAKTETTFDTDASPTAADDAFLVEAPDFTPDITVLRRNNVKEDLSPDPTVTGRKLAQITFQHEVRSNGNTDGTAEPRVGRLLKACGFTVEQVSAAADTLEQTDTDTGTGGDIQFVATTAYAGTVKRNVQVEITVGGGSGDAQARFTSEAFSDLLALDTTGTDEVVLTDGQEVLLYDTGGNLVVGVTPYFTSVWPEVGDRYNFDLRPLGYYYTPISENFDSLTLKLYLPDDSGQSLLHTVTGARGTFSMNAQANDYARFTFTFTGSYNAVTDVTTPTGVVYETQQPQQVEYADLTILDDSGYLRSLCAASFSIDAQVDIQPRECINEPDSYQGALITGRQPTLSFDPEAVLEATHPFWQYLSDATSVLWRARVGTTKGNVVGFEAQNIQYSDLAYADRNNTRVYNVTANLARVTGNDEMVIYFA